MKMHYSKMENLLKNNIYAGYLLIVPNTDKNKLGGFSKKSNGDISFDINKFKEISNLEGIIEKKIFEVVYSALNKGEVIGNKEYDPFLFKGVMKCGNCGKQIILLKQNNFLMCENKCFIFYDDDLICYLLGIIVDTMYTKSSSEGIFDKFRCSIENKVRCLSSSLDREIKNKAEVLEAFILNDNNSKDNMNEFLVIKNKDIIFKKRIITGYREKLEILENLKNILDNSIGVEVKVAKEIRKLMVRYLWGNRERFKDLLEGLVTSIKVGVKDGRSLNTEITYEFKADASRNIYESVYPKTK